MRKRDLKPGFFKDPELVELPFEFRLLFVGLWLMADREGRLEDRPKKIRMEVFPADDVDCDAGLNALADKKKIVRYEVEGTSYVWIPGFAEHQHPHPKEVASTLPPCPGQTSGPMQDDLFHAQALSSRAGSSFPSGSSGSSGPSGSSPPAGGGAEPQGVSTPALTRLPLVDGSEFPIHQSDVDEWAKVYPAVDVPHQLLRMREWILSNPTQRKTVKGVRRFVTTWLGKEQDRGGSRTATSSREPESLADRNRAAAEAFKRDHAGEASR